jgi:hypothetical protein
MLCYIQKTQTSHQALQERQGEVEKAWLQTIMASFGSPKASPQQTPLAYLYHLPLPAWFDGHLSQLYPINTPVMHSVTTAPSSTTARLLVQVGCQSSIAPL